MKLPDLSREPVRAYIYSVATALLLLLVGFGVIDAEVKDAVGAFLAAVLVVAGTEKARASVTPTA